MRWLCTLTVILHLLWAVHAKQVSFSVNVFKDAHDKGSTASCRCQKALDPKALAPVMQPCALKNVDVTGITDEALLNAVKLHVGPANEVRVAAISDVPLSCGEHRTTGEIVGSYGGDPVEIILAAGIVEKQIEKPLKKAEVIRLTRTYVAKGRAPYTFYHTDVAALAFIQKKLGVGNLNIMDPPAQLQSSIVRIMTQNPDAHGCVYIRDLVASPAKYEIRPELVSWVIEALHSILWASRDPLRNRLRYYVYANDGLPGKAQVLPAPPPPAHKSGAEPVTNLRGFSAAGVASSSLHVMGVLPSASPSPAARVQRRAKGASPLVSPSPSASTSPQPYANSSAAAISAQSHLFSLLEPLQRGRFAGILRPVRNIGSLNDANQRQVQLHIARSGMGVPTPAAPTSSQQASQPTPPAPPIVASSADGRNAQLQQQRLLETGSGSVAGSVLGDGGGFGLGMDVDLDGFLPATSSSGPRAVLDIRLSPDCSSRGPGRVVPLPPTLRAPVGTHGSASSSSAPAFIVVHSEAIKARRAATVGLLVQAFGVDGDGTSDALMKKGEQWTRLAEELHGIGTELPKLLVVIA